MYKILFYDWKESPCAVIDDFVDVINKWDLGPIAIRRVETFDDQYAVVVGCFPLSQSKADEAYKKWLNSDSGEEWVKL